MASLRAGTAVALFLLTGFPVADAFIDRLVPKHEPHKCLDLDRGDTSNGNRLVIWDCYDTPSQQFMLGDHIIYKKDITKCVDFFGSIPAKGNHLQIWDCKDLHYQKWTYNFEDSTVRLATGTNQDLCLQLEYQKSDNGTPVTIWECNGHESQQWALSDDRGNVYAGDERNLEFVVPIIILSVLLGLSLLFNCCQRWRQRKAAQRDASSANKDMVSIGAQQMHSHLEETTSEQGSQA